MVERCGHPLPWKRLNLHEYLSRLGWTSRWQASHLLCFMPITRYNKCHERVNEMYRLMWGIFPDLICCDVWRGHCLEDECWPSELLLTDDLKRTLNCHNLVNWAAVGGKKKKQIKKLVYTSKYWLCFFLLLLFCTRIHYSYNQLANHLLQDHHLGNAYLYCAHCDALYSFTSSWAQNDNNNN